MLKGRMYVLTYYAHAPDGLFGSKTGILAEDRFLVYVTQTRADLDVFDHADVLDYDPVSVESQAGKASHFPQTE